MGNHCCSDFVIQEQTKFKFLKRQGKRIANSDQKCRLDTFLAEKLWHPTLQNEKIATKVEMQCFRVGLFRTFFHAAPDSRPFPF